MKQPTCFLVLSKNRTQNCSIMKSFCESSEKIKRSICKSHMWFTWTPAIPFLQYKIPSPKIPKIKSKNPPKYLLNMGCNSCSGIKIQTLDSFNKLFFFLTLKIETSILYTFVCIITSIFIPPLYLWELEFIKLVLQLSHG